MAGSRCRSKSSSNPQRGLHPPLSDPAELSKVTHHHKLLCQFSQEPLPVGGITSAYGQKCSQASSKPKISGLFQPTFPGAKTKQPLETYSRSEQTKSFPQGVEIQNGDHEDLPPTRGVGYLNRFQGLPCTYTGTIQEISEISHPRSDIPVQGSAIWFVHSTHGVHCNSKGGKTDGQTQGYKNPPVPRRLVGESQVPPNLFPAYTRSSKNVSTTGLAGEFKKIKAGAQTTL